MDSQLVELLGRNRLVDELIRAGIEVSLPLRDRGIDLIAYFDSDEQIGCFSAVPIQMKASTRAGFGIHSKYAKFPNLVIVHLWHVDSPQYQSFATTHAQSIEIADAMGWTKTDSWINKGGYDCTRPSRELIKKL